MTATEPDDGPIGEVPPAVLAYESRIDVTRAEVVRLTGERDAALEHVAYHLRDFRPGADDKATGDLAVDMAAYAGRLKIRADAAEARLRAVEALADAGDAREVWQRRGEVRTADLRAALSSDAAPHEVVDAPAAPPEGYGWQDPGGHTADPVPPAAPEGERP